MTALAHNAINAELRSIHNISAALVICGDAKIALHRLDRSLNRLVDCQGVVVVPSRISLSVGVYHILTAEKTIL